MQIKYLVEGDCRQQSHTTVAVVQIKCLVEGSHVSYGWLDQDDNSRGGGLPTAITQNPKVVVVQMKCLVEGMSHGWLYQIQSNYTQLENQNRKLMNFVLKLIIKGKSMDC